MLDLRKISVSLVLALYVYVISGIKVRYLSEKDLLNRRNSLHKSRYILYVLVIAHILTLYFLDKIDKKSTTYLDDIDNT